MANKQAMFNVGLDEIKKMTPQEAYILMQRLDEVAREIEIARQTNGTG